VDVPNPALAGEDDGPGLERYVGAIERELVPRILASSRVGPFPPEMMRRAGEVLDDERVSELVRRIRGGDEEATGRFVAELLADGVESEVIFLDLITPAARRLGKMWEEDTCDFVEVTLALGRLHRALRGLSHLFLSQQPPAASVGRILLSNVPGEQHTLGLVMVAEFFVRAGWTVDLGHPLDSPDLGAVVRDEWYDVAGFSAACDTSLGTLKREVGRVRRASRNPRLRILVGGRVFDDAPALVKRVGADASASDAREAPAVAASLL
jgi:MerR family transcriptional regulator, light-induced transcriptional regulator